MKKILFSLLLSLSLIGVANATSFSGLSNLNKKTTEDKKSYKELLVYLEKQGDGENLFYLANIYLNGSYKKDSFGEVVEKDTEKALYWFKKSVELGYPYAPITLGSLFLYHEDFIVMKDNIEKAEKYLKYSIEIDVFEATTSLADIYFNFKGEPKKAIEYLYLGAENNVATAQYALAVVYNKGLKSENFTLDKSNDISAMYLTKACLNKKKTKKIEALCNNNKLITREKIGE